MARPVAPRGEGRERVLAAALDLFAEHGVSGTSLQMIADALGVTKAAVYFQFRAKDDIVAAVLEPVGHRLLEVVEQAERERTRPERTRRALVGLVDVVLAHRRLVGVLRGDPSIVPVLERDAAFQDCLARLGTLLVGTRPSADTRVAASVVGAGLMLATTDPALADLDDAVLGAQLLRVAELLLVPGTAAP